MTSHAAEVSNGRTAEMPTSTAHRGVRVVPRLPDIDFADVDVPRHWHRGSIGLTAFWNALTIAGPPIESFFLRDGRKLLPRIRSQAQRTEFVDFMRQEAYHSRVHQRAYQLYERWGVPYREVDALTRTVLAWLERFTTTRLRSAIVVAGEHFLGEIAHQGLGNPAVFEGADPRMARLLLWHFYEEMEHKAVYFDAFVDAYGDTATTHLHRVAGLLMTVAVLAILLPMATARLLRAEGAMWRWSEWEAIGRYLFGERGFWRGRFAASIAFLSPRFHPWRYRDDAAPLARYADLAPEAWARAAERAS